MKARSAPQLLDRLASLTEENLAAARQFAELDTPTLHQRPRPDAWNVLENLAHLNHYGAYYLPEIRRRIAATRHRDRTDTFTSGWLGNKFAAGMKPGANSPKVTTFKSADPRNFPTPPDRATLREFIRQQEDLLELLDLARGVNLTRTKTGISISRLIKLRLGDTLRVVVYHNWRHLVQAREALAATGVTTTAP